MSADETGLKWWVRYVIVPLLAGGAGIAAFWNPVAKHTHLGRNSQDASSNEGAKQPVSPPPLAPEVAAKDGFEKADGKRPRQITQRRRKTDPVEANQRPNPTQPPSFTLNADNNQGNVAGINYGIQNIYSAKKPLPNIGRIYTTVVPAESQDLSIGRYAKNAGLEISFNVDAPFTDPFFRVSCDNPCKPTDIRFGHGGQASGGWVNGAPFLKTNDPTVVGVGGGLKKVVYPNEFVIITVRAIDENRPLQRVISVVADEQQ